MKTHIKILLIGVGFALSVGSLAPIAPPAWCAGPIEETPVSLGDNQPQTPTDLPGKIDQIIRKSLEQRVRFSIHIIEADSGKTVYDHDARELMIPASNMKIITSAAALNYLGSDFVYKTKVGLCGDTLVVIGSGDPLLGDERKDSWYGREPGWIFKDISHALKTEGIEKIDSIIVDSTVFDNERVHPSWPAKDLNKWYACEVSGLNYNDNCVKISVKNVEGKIAIFVDPQTTFVSLINNVESISKGDGAVGTYRNRHPNTLIVFGKCRDAAGPFDVAIERPAAFFGFLLFEHLVATGINAQGQLVEKTFDEENDFNPLIEFTTSMADCLKRCNKNSLGLAAEAMLKTIAAYNNPDGKNGSWERGRELVADYLMELGIDKSQFYLDDGSGLSRQNELTAYAITTVLSSLYKSEDWPIYRDSLSMGGVDGTISGYFKEEPYKGKIRGKTGYINGVRSLSGVCSTDQGDYIFSILVNNANGQTRTVINEIAKTIIDHAAQED
ncbi:MAG: D-alanyl-D-alanine carboxypeptidase/D-alanyl-D-alanine-endopeptidase [Sedimentisphaerales bacterium]|nr:D-alanyl-D-alanine carboxypeptidase/D-alanyl-D-alanine-endopeptidase [Sedimentisphaerales bacterium]